MPADIESNLIFETAASNTAPSPDGLPAASSPNIVYTEGREVLALNKRWWNRVNPTITSGGTANAQTLTYGVAPLLYTLGQCYTFIVGIANTGPLTINVNGLGAKAVQVNGAALVGGELKVGLIIELAYDGTQFQIIGGSAFGTGLYLPIAGGTLTGALNGTTAAFSGLVTALTPTAGDNSTKTATTAFVATNFLPLTGGSLTGNLTVSATSGATIITLASAAANNPLFIFNKPASGQANIIQGRTNNVMRWVQYLGDSTAESAGSGSDFSINRYNDAGTLIDAPIFITRLNGNVVLNGTPTNDSASAGKVGEFISSVVVSPGVTLTNVVVANVTSISLTAGDWDVSGEVNVAVGTGGATAVNIAISNTSATYPALGVGASRLGLNTTFGASLTSIFPLASTRISLAATTTIYLVAQAAFPSGTTTAFGKIEARRRR